MNKMITSLVGPARLLCAICLASSGAACGSPADSSATHGASADGGGVGAAAGNGGSATPDAATDAAGGASGTSGSGGHTGDSDATATDAGCGDGLSSCAGECVELDRDPRHCGACDHACDGGERCCQGECVDAIAGDAPPLAALDACGTLAYGRYANEAESNKVNTLPDFSYAGYERGGVAIPDVPVVRTVQPGSGDDRSRIQQAIDEVAALPLAADGFRGAVLLEKGRYRISSSILIQADGVVLRGEGQGEDGTVIELSGTDQATAITLSGSGSGPGEVPGSRTRITSGYVGVGSRGFDVESGANLSVGDDVAVIRTPNQAWIDELKMGPYGWTPSAYAIAHERKIAALDGNHVTLDIPVVDAMQDKYGGGALFQTKVTGRIRHCGVEDLRLESTYASETDEQHGWTGISLSRTTNSWVRRVTVRYFGYSAVLIDNGSNFNTVEETAMLDPKSQITGGRRYPFQVGGGLGNLFQRCYARGGRHNFVTGSRVTGPNVWLDCAADENHADDGPHHRWSTGLLFDNVSSTNLNVQNRKDSGTGHGWAGAQVLFWNVDEQSIICDAPRGAMNYVVGGQGAKNEGSWAPEEAFGTWESTGTVVEPRSLFLQQLGDRLGPAAVEAITVPAQRTGRIWVALRAWAGEGRLADHL